MLTIGASACLAEFQREIISVEECGFELRLAGPCASIAHLLAMPHG
jgi:hypothetical protein